MIRFFHCMMPVMRKFFPFHHAEERFCYGILIRRSRIGKGLNSLQIPQELSEFEGRVHHTLITMEKSILWRGGKNYMLLESARTASACDAQ